MNDAQIVEIVQQTLWVALQLSAPILLVTLVVGLVISVLQAATQISEMTLTFLPKLLVAGAVTIFTFPWMLHVFRDYFEHLIFMFRTAHS